MGGGQVIVIGLTGFARSGKGTVADRLVARHGFKKMSFAAPLKRVLREMDPIIGTDPMLPGQPITLSQALERMGEDGVKNLFPLYRRYLQKLGTDGIRSIDPKFWINAALKEVREQESDARLVFDDCRFPNEADMIHYQLPQYTTELWQVDRDIPQVEGIERHVSESHVGFMGEDMVIDNNGSLDDLYWTVDELARDLKQVEAVKLAA